MVLSMGPTASGITWGVGSRKGGEGCWWSRGSLVSSKDGTGGSLWHVGHLQGAGGHVCSFSWGLQALLGRALLASHGQLPAVLFPTWGVRWLCVSWHLCLW